MLHCVCLCECVFARACVYVCIHFDTMSKRSQRIWTERLSRTFFFYPIVIRYLKVVIAIYSAIFTIDKIVIDK